MSDPPIRAEIEARADRQRAGADRWVQGQGREIRATHPAPVYYACHLAAIALAKEFDFEALTDAQFAICEARAYSTACVQLWGAGRRPSDWRDQVREYWARPREPSQRSKNPAQRPTIPTADQRRVMAAVAARKPHADALEPPAPDAVPEWA